jgi:predicted O-methyltransferase YrrM
LTGNRDIRHYWEELPGPNWFSGVELYARQVARAENGATFVELGAWKGRSTAFMAVEIALSGKDIAFYTVDHWRGSGEEAHLRDSDLANARLYEVFQANIEPVRNYVEPIVGDTAAVAARFADASVAFVYVDAGHTFADVSADLVAWWPKLEQGGIIAGDDWCDSDDNYGVRRAVTAFFAPRGLEIEISPGSPIVEWLQWSVAKA